METYQWAATVAALWCLIYLFDSYSKLNARERWKRTYRGLISDNGVSIHPARCQWYTSRLNHIFTVLGQLNPHLLAKWFDVGVVASLLCCVCSVVFLTMIPVNTLLRDQSKDEQILKPVIPGVNLPRKDLGYYLFTLFVSAVLHEFGHAIAAVRESVKVHGFGVFLFVVYPGAFVDMDDQTLFAVSAWRQLRIFCAGVWHNLVIVAVGVAMLYSMPLTLSPLYTVRENLVVVSHTERSVVSGQSGFLPGDLITRLDATKVDSMSQWVDYIISSIESQQTISFSVPKATLLEHSKPIILTASECTCDEDNHICFHLPASEHPQEYTRCMSAREVITYSRCGEDTVDCVTPYIGHLSNHTRLIVIYRSKKPPVLFFGHPAELHTSVILGEVAPKYPSAPLWLPYSLENLFKCFVSLSGALAILNIVPCYAMDGQHIARAFIAIAFKSYSRDTQELILTLVVLFGTFLLCSNVLLAMYGLLF